MMWRVTALSACVLSIANAQLTSGVNGNEAKQPIFLTPDPTPMPTGVPPAPTPMPTQPSDCQGDWGSWGACSVTCGKGKQYKSFMVTKPAVGWGLKCPTTVSRDCKMPDCMEKGFPKYFIKKTDTCQVYATSKEECEAAAKSLEFHGDGRPHLDDFTATVSRRRSGRRFMAPPNCYWEGGELMYNEDKSSKVECSNKHKCICKMDGCRAHDNIKFKTVAKKERKDSFCMKKCNNMKKCRKKRTDCTKCNEQCACTASIEIDKRLKKKKNLGNRRREGGKFENGPVRLV